MICRREGRSFLEDGLKETADAGSSCAVNKVSSKLSKEVLIIVTYLQRSDQTLPFLVANALKIHSYGSFTLLSHCWTHMYSMKALIGQPSMF